MSSDNPKQRLADLHSKIWRTLEHAVADGSAPARTMALATVGECGGAEARMVVLRGADPNTAQLFFHTDVMSAKVSEISDAPQATLLSWDPVQKLQIRLKCKITVKSGPEVEAHWRRIPAPSRNAYGVLPHPGSPLMLPEALNINPRSERFAVMACQVNTIDALIIAETCHSRARFQRAEDWTGHWIAP